MGIKKKESIVVYGVVSEIPGAVMVFLSWRNHIRGCLVFLCASSCTGNSENELSMPHRLAAGEENRRRLIIHGRYRRVAALPPLETLGEHDDSIRLNPMNAPFACCRDVDRHSVFLEGRARRFYHVLETRYKRNRDYLLSAHDGFGDAPYRRRIYMRLYAVEDGDGDDSAEGERTLVSEKSGILVEAGVRSGPAHRLEILRGDAEAHVGKRIAVEIGLEDTGAEGGSDYAGGSESEDDGYHGVAALYDVRLFRRRHWILPCCM